jgi:hypothetical protein
VIDGYKADPQTLKLLTSLALSDQVPYTLKDGIISYNGRVWLGHSSEIQSRVISALHASALGGHSGFPVTYARIKLVLLATYEATDPRLCRCLCLLSPSKIGSVTLSRPVATTASAKSCLTSHFP